MFKRITSALLLLLMLFNTCAFSEGDLTEADDPADELIDMILEGEDGGEWIDPDLPELTGEEIYLAVGQEGEFEEKSVYVHFPVPDNMILYYLLDYDNAAVINEDTGLTYEYLSGGVALECLSGMSEDGVITITREDGETYIDIGNTLTYEYVSSGEETDRTIEEIAGDKEESDAVTWYDEERETAYAIINPPAVSGDGWFLLAINQADGEEADAAGGERLLGLMDAEIARLSEVLEATQTGEDLGEDELVELRAGSDLSAAVIKVGSKWVKLTPNDVSHRSVCNSCNKTAVGKGSHWCCWGYAALEYKKIWGTGFSRYGANLLRNIPAANRKLTVANLDYFFSNAKAGAMLRIDKESAATKGDNNGHSLIFLGKSGQGGWFWEGNYDGKGRVRIHYWSWSDLASKYSRYTYVKYIIYPGAPALKDKKALPGLSVAGEKYPSGTLTRGKSFGLRGEYTATGGVKITEVTAMVTNSMGMPVSGFMFTCKVNGTYFKVNGTKGTNGKTLNDTFIFNNLRAGTYKMVVSVKTTQSKYDRSVVKSFTVK